MSGVDIKKPETREILIKMLSDAAKNEVCSKGKPTKPTVVGTAKEMDIHIDALYSWLSQRSTRSKRRHTHRWEVRNTIQRYRTFSTRLP
jgi:hypothetical protein